MNDDKRRVMVNGQWTEGTPVKVVAAQAEPWTEYLLSDGTLLRMKMTAFEVTRADGVFEADGTPVYVVKYGVLQNAQAPNALREVKEQSS